MPQQNSRLRCHLPHCFHLRQLCELVDCNVQVLKAPDITGERAQYVEPPDREWPGERDRLKGLSWLMKLLQMELARFTLGDQLNCILDSCGLAKSLSEGFCNQIPCRQSLPPWFLLADCLGRCQGVGQALQRVPEVQFQATFASFCTQDHSPCLALCRLGT